MPKSPPAISLIIPAYNRGDLIAETIESALCQTSPFCEIIVVDDGSTDNTQAVLAHYTGRITIIRTPNNGVQSARNTGIEAANTELVALCDSDDLLASTFCETVVPWISNHPEIDICFSNFTTFDDVAVYPDKLSIAPGHFFDGATDINEHFLINIPDLYQRTLSYQPFFQSGLIIRKTFFNHIGGYDLRFKGVGAEDWEFTLRAIANGKVALCVLPLARVRRHPGNDSGNAMRMNIGEAQILEFGLAHHRNAKRYEKAILQTIDERRRRAFDAAFALGNFTLVNDLRARIRNSPSETKFLLKCIIAKFPTFIRNRLWKLTQR